LYTIVLPEFKKKLIWNAGMKIGMTGLKLR
jgi:hypothetical protein